MSEEFTYDSAYEDAINLLIEMKSEDLIGNQNFEHARSLIRLLVEKLQIDRYIGIFTLNLCEAAYGPQRTVDVFKKRLSEGKSLKVLFQREPDQEALRSNPFYQQILCKPDYKKMIETRVLLPEHCGLENHLLTVNNKAFRIETSHEKTTAIAGFNNEIGEGVRNYFERLFSNNYSRELLFTCVP